MGEKKKNNNEKATVCSAPELESTISVVLSSIWQYSYNHLKHTTGQRRHVTLAILGKKN